MPTYPLSHPAAEHSEQPWVTPLARSFDPETLNQRLDSRWQEETVSGRNSLVSAVVRAFAADLWLTSFLRLLVYFSDVALPLLVARIIQQISNASSDASKKHSSTPAALVTLLAYACLALAGALVEQNQIDLRDRTALKIRIALTAAVHNKTIETGGILARQQLADVYSSGIHCTAQLASHIVALSQAIWLPVRVVAGLYVFYRQVGWAVTPGIIVILLYLPLRTRFIARRSAAHAQAAKASNQRVSLITQLLDNIVSLRMLGWDSLLVERIMHIRKTVELQHITESAVATLLLTFARNACRAGGPLISLFLYSTLSRLVSPRLGPDDASVDKDAERSFVTTEQVFVVQAILRELFPLLIDVPHAFDSWWDAKLPYQKVLGILTSTTGSANNKPNVADPVDEKLADNFESWDIRIVNGEFSWKNTDNVLEKPVGNNAFTLSNVNVDIRPNQLIAVVGVVGSGKSSFLSAVLGEMHQSSGFRHVAKQTAFVSQSPWLMASTVRDNIVFGNAFDSHWYSR
ncbi:ATP-binding cassette glutathione S-conjugate transporter ycf1, partial [Coemansia sp. RSA 2599]